MKRKMEDKSKNKKILDSFVEYCRENPNERFWQALRNWSRFDFIIGRTKGFDDGDAFDYGTFYFKWRNK